MMWKKSILILAFLSLISIQVGSVHAWYSDNWTYAKNITFNSTRIGEDNLTDFSVLISITDSNLSQFAQPDGDDILFTNLTDSKLNHEIEFFNSTNGQLIAWVKVPVLRNVTENTTIRMYYNNSAAANQENVTETWRSEYLAVHHFEETNFPVNDSTQYATDSIASSGTSFVDSFIGSGRNYTASTNAINLSGAGVLRNLRNFTISMIMRPDTLPIAQGVYEKGFNQKLMRQTGVGRFTFGLDTTGTNIDVDTQAGVLQTNRWHIIYFNFDEGATVRGRIYNGSSNIFREVGYTFRASDSGTFVDENTVNFTIGNRNGGTSGIDSNIDEFRIYNGTLSFGWMATEFDNIFFPAEFISVSGEEQQAGGQPPTDTCTPTANEDWVLNLSDNCNIEGLDISILKWNITATNGGTSSISHSNITFTGLNIERYTGIPAALRFLINVILRW